MKSYEVELRCEITETVRTTVSVEARDSAEAIEKAKVHARSHGDEWAVKYGDKRTMGDILVDHVEEIVDLEDGIEE